MSKPLFDNVGKDLKKIAEIIAQIIMILHVLIGLVLIIVACVLFADEATIALGIACLLVGAGIVVWGYILSRLLVIVLYAYGELVEKVTSIEEKLVGKKVPGKPDTKIFKVKKLEETPKTKKESDGSWQCIFCEHTNPAGADWCEDCGVQANFE